jgi:hypothetical protein
MRYVCLTEPGDWQTYVISGKCAGRKSKDMRYVCLTEPGDWQTYVISGKCAGRKRNIE